MEEGSMNNGAFRGMTISLMDDGLMCGVLYTPLHSFTWNIRTTHSTITI